MADSIRSPFTVYDMIGLQLGFGSVLIDGVDMLARLMYYC